MLTSIIGYFLPEDAPMDDLCKLKMTSIFQIGLKHSQVFYVFDLVITDLRNSIMEVSFGDQEKSCVVGYSRRL